MITNALIISTNPEDFTNQYGGETLINRCLIALSKSGFKMVHLLCSPGEKSNILESLSKVNPTRLQLNYEVNEFHNLRESILLACARWGQNFLICESRILLHPTLLTQLTGITEAAHITYKGVLSQGGLITYEEYFKAKFKVIFSDKRRFRALEGGAISTDIVIVNAGFISKCDFSNFDEFMRLCTSQLRVLPVTEAWWARVHPGALASDFKDLFWKIAFKEISGEFSKAVNSKLSRPLSFWLADLGVAPNTISNLSVVLFLVSSALLLIPEYWAIVSFAMIWQFTAGILDRCDGEIARIRNYETEAGGQFDMVVDDLRFALPMIALAIACYWEGGGHWIYLVVLGITLVVSLSITLIEQKAMRKLGYVSRQKLNVDYIKLKGEIRGISRVLKDMQPIFKGDIRTFYIFCLSFLGEKPILFWVLVFYHAFVSGLALFGTITFPKLLKKSHSNSEGT